MGFLVGTPIVAVIGRCRRNRARTYYIISDGTQVGLIIIFQHNKLLGDTYSYLSILNNNWLKAVHI